MKKALIIILAVAVFMPQAAFGALLASPSSLTATTKYHSDPKANAQIASLMDQIRVLKSQLSEAHAEIAKLSKKAPKKTLKKEKASSDKEALEVERARLNKVIKKLIRERDELAMRLQPGSCMNARIKGKKSCSDYKNDLRQAETNLTVAYDALDEIGVQLGLIRVSK